MMLIRVSSFILLSLLFGLPSASFSAPIDYNKEFADNYFKLDRSDADVNLKVVRKSPAIKVDPIGKQDGNARSRKEDSKEDGVSISNLGRILQLSLGVLLGFLIFTLSRRSKKKKGF